MRVARLYATGEVRVEEAGVPRVARGEMLVRTRACGVCSGELTHWYVRRKAPLVLGHEPVGEVAELGPGVDGFSVGERVFAHHHAPCLACPACRRGAFVHCRTWRRTRLVPGGLAEYFLVPAESVATDTLPLPDQLSDEDGTLIEPLACVVKSLDRAGLEPGGRVAIIGLGVMGLLHVVLARSFGARQVLGIDPVPFRARKGAALGAEPIPESGAAAAAALRERTGGDGAEVVIVGPGTPAALELGLACVAPGGTVVMFMATPAEVRVPLAPHELYFREVRLVPSYSCGPPHTREALRLLTAGVVRAEQVVTHRFPLAAAPEAYRTAADPTRAVKTLIIFP